MKSSIQLSFLALFLFMQTFSPVAADVDSLCSTLGGYYVPSDYCKATFLRDPRSRTANNAEFAIISIDLVIADTTKLQSDIEQLSKEAEQATKQRLESCSNHLSGVTPLLNEAKVAAATKNYAKAADLIVKYENGPQACLDEFSVSKVMHESSALINLGHLAKSTNEFNSGNV